MDKPVKPLSKQLPPLILGGAGFSYQCHPDPESLPVSKVIIRAFDSGMTAIDTSPYYEPSEQLIGKALQDPEITRKYSREDYILMTKVGRIKSDIVDYSTDWVRQSVERSLTRFGTTYLDVVFCHDVEFVTEEDTLGAIGVLLNFVRDGKLRYIGISSYRIDILARLAQLTRQQFGRPLDIIQNWGQMNLQNGRLEKDGLKKFEEAGVTCVLNASPLNIGLLRNGGVPIGKLGDFHPAPQGLRKRVQDVADYIASRGENLAAVALRYALWRCQEMSNDLFRVCTITGISNISDLTENVETALKILKPREGSSRILSDVSLDLDQLRKDKPLFEEAQAIFGEWMDYGFTSPDPRWSIKLKRMMSNEAVENS